MNTAIILNVQQAMEIFLGYCHNDMVAGQPEITYVSKTLILSSWPTNPIFVVL
jgi:hypothetical protein